MKLRNLVSAIAAAAVAVTSAISVSAEKVAVDVNDPKYVGASGDKGKYVTLFQSDKLETPIGYCVDTDLPLSDVYGFKVYVKFDQTELSNGTWVAGGIAANSDSRGWDCIEWSTQEGAKPITADLTENSVTYFDADAKSPLFKDTDTYCQLHFQTWGGTVEIVKFELLSRKGRVLTGYAEAAATEPAETTPAETEPAETEPVVTEPTEEPVDEPTEEPVDEPTEEPVGETAEAEVDWDAYDPDAAEAANEAFVFGVDQTIDLYAVLGDDLYDLNKVEATFTWDAGAGWCGGAGLGNGIVLDDGSEWISGPEYGAANANADIVDDGVATQTIIDLGDSVIEQIAAVGDDGVSVFGALFVQNWWNGVEANAQLASLTFYNADGDVIGELVYSEAEAPAPAAPSEDKGNPDTGVEGIAIVAGLAAVAGVAFVVSRKRK